MTPTPKRWAKVGTTLTERMNAIGLSQADVARISGVSDPVVRSLMRGEPGQRRPTSLRKVALGVGWTADSIDLILSGKEPAIADQADNASDSDRYDDLSRQLAELRAEVEVLKLWRQGIETATAQLNRLDEYERRQRGGKRAHQ